MYAAFHAGQPHAGRWEEFGVKCCLKSHKTSPWHGFQRPPAQHRCPEHRGHPCWHSMPVLWPSSQALADILDLGRLEEDV